MPRLWEQTGISGQRFARKHNRQRGYKEIYQLILQRTSVRDLLRNKSIIDALKKERTEVEALSQE